MLSQAGLCLFPHTCIHKNAQYAESTASSRPDPSNNNSLLESDRHRLQPEVSLIISIVVNGISFPSGTGIFLFSYYCLWPLARDHLVVLTSHPDHGGGWGARIGLC